MPLAPVSAPVVAVINTSEDMVSLLTTLLTSDGFRPVAGFIPDFREGRADLAAFLHEHEPAVIVWDIALPYDRNWRYIQDVRASGVMADCPLVLTTTNKRALDELVGPTTAIELVGKPYDIEELLASIRRAIGRPPA